MSIRDDIHKAIDRIGKTPTTSCPDTKSNVMPVVHDLFIAQELRARANKMYERAKAAFLDLALFEPNDVPEGSSAAVYDSDYYNVNLKVANASERCDIKRFRTELQKLGVKPETIDKAYVLSVVRNSPARTYTVTHKLP